MSSVSSQTQPLPSFRMTHATIMRDREMQQRSVVMQDGRISKGALPEVNLSGYWILPGVIDLHGDAFERHMRRVSACISQWKRPFVQRMRMRQRRA